MELQNKIKNRELRSIAEKVCQGVPVSDSDAEYMLTTNDILDLGSIANFLRSKLHGNNTYYGVNINLNYTNICQLRCPICAFSRDEDDEDAYCMTLGQIEERIRKALPLGIDEVHIVGGLHPTLTIDYYESMIRRIKSIKPSIFVVAFTAVEYDHFARLNSMSLEEVFKRLIDAGVGALPGGGAEIFSPRVRNVITPKKITGEEWIDVMRTAHKMGIKTNATMLYNHIESVEDIVDHLSRIRSLQEETGGFKTFVPLLYHDRNARMKSNRSTITGFDDIRIYATSRIYLHNVTHLKSLWMYVGDKMAQVLLKFGVDEMGATYNNEKIVHSAGAQTPDYGSESFLRRLIEEARFNPIRSTANYTIN
ncbi:MAG: CofH family radical SAM protein [Spirochaetota bacterium]|nr:CofH family radical SAM protein [Spirochaetota bacterium]